MLSFSIRSQTPGPSGPIPLSVDYLHGMPISSSESEISILGWPISTCRLASGWRGSSTPSPSLQPSCSPWPARTSGLWTRCVFSAMCPRRTRRISAALQEKELMFMDSSWKVLAGTYKLGSFKKPSSKISHPPCRSSLFGPSQLTNRRPRISTSVPYTRPVLVDRHLSGHST